MMNSDSGLLQRTETFKTQEPLLAQVQKTIEQNKKKEETKHQKDAPKVEPPKVNKYTVQEGDSLSSIAEKNNTEWLRLWKKNTQLKHQDQLTVGEELIIPEANEELADRETVNPVVKEPVAVPQTGAVQTTSQSTSVPSTQSVSRAYVGGVNGYALGWCTWWVKEKRPDIGGYWGNAGYNWISAARSAGYSTGSEPVPGAIGVTNGHVVFVESVSGNSIYLSEMGWGGVANSSPHYRTASKYDFTYIY